MSRILLVGESNPYGANPDWALYPHPVGCSGWRLCYTIIGMTEAAYFDTFDRVNLCAGPWSMTKARATIESLPQGPRILLGRKVAAAHGITCQPFTDVLGGWLVWPHPSGLNRQWTREAIVRARAQFAEFRRSAPTPGNATTKEDETT